MSIMPPDPDSKLDTPAARPPGVPKGARLVTLAELQDSVAKSGGSLRLGPRSSYLRFQMKLWPFVLIGRAHNITGGVSREHGKRVFGLGYQHGRRGNSEGKIMVFLNEDAADRQLWIWTLDDERHDLADF